MVENCGTAKSRGPGNTGVGESLDQKRNVGCERNAAKADRPFALSFPRCEVDDAGAGLEASLPAARAGDNRCIPHSK